MLKWICCEFFSSRRTFKRKQKSENVKSDNSKSVMTLTYSNIEYWELKTYGDSVIVGTLRKSLCSSKLIQSLKSEYFMELTSNTHRLNYLAADSKVSGCDGAPFQVSTKAPTFGIFVVKNQNSTSLLPSALFIQKCKVTQKPMTFTFCCP